MAHYNKPLNDYKHFINSIKYIFGVEPEEIFSEENLLLIANMFTKKKIVTVTNVEKYLNDGITYDKLKVQFEIEKYKNVYNFITSQKQWLKTLIIEKVNEFLTINDAINYEKTLSHKITGLVNSYLDSLIFEMFKYKYEKGNMLGEIIRPITIQNAYNDIQQLIYNHYEVRLVIIRDAYYWEDYKDDCEIQQNPQLN